MLRKTLITMTAIAALGVGSPAMAAHGGGGFGGGRAGGFGGSHLGGFAGPGIAAAHGGGSAFAHAAAPMVSGRVHGWTGNTVGRSDFAGGRGRDHFHRRFGHGFGGPYYDFGGSYDDSAYGSCWTYDGVQWVYACGDYQY